MSEEQIAAEKYADSCSPNNKRPSIGSTKSLEIGFRSLWESERESFLAGAAYEREKAQAKLERYKSALLIARKYCDAGAVESSDYERLSDIIDEALEEQP